MQNNQLPLDPVQARALIPSRLILRPFLPCSSFLVPARSCHPALNCPLLPSSTCSHQIHDHLWAIHRDSGRQEEPEKIDRGLGLGLRAHGQGVLSCPVLFGRMCPETCGEMRSTRSSRFVYGAIQRMFHLAHQHSHAIAGVWSCSCSSLPPRTSHTHLPYSRLPSGSPPPFPSHPLFTSPCSLAPLCNKHLGLGFHMSVACLLHSTLPLPRWTTHVPHTKIEMTKALSTSVSCKLNVAAHRAQIS
jgi:hypothetical protein